MTSPSTTRAITALRPASPMPREYMSGPVAIRATIQVNCPIGHSGAPPSNGSVGPADRRVSAVDLEALPLDTLADAALGAARTPRVSHAEVRVERTRVAATRARDGRLESDADGGGAGLSVRVLHDGTWGFAATSELSTDAAARAAREALEVARVAAALSTERVELAAEPAHVAVWRSSYEIDPFDVPAVERAARLIDWTGRLVADERVDHADASLEAVQEQKFYADLAGSRTIQERIRVDPDVTAVAVDRGTGTFESMRTVAPPTGRGWEYLTGTGWDWDAELAALPELLAEKMAAPTAAAGAYDVVIDPSNLWLTIHESIGHATELDRALGYEAAYAGTSFATFDQLDRLRYGAPFMHVTADRTVEHGLATVGFDDEGVEAQAWDLIRDGTLVGYQLNRAMAARQGYARSNGCAFAHRPLPAGADPQHRRRGGPVSPADPSRRLVEHALAVSAADGCVVLASESTSANLRWAANTLTTNGLAHARRLTVISFFGPSVGVVSREGIFSTADVAEVVGASEAVAREASPAEDAAPLLGSEASTGDWDAPPAEASISVFDRFAPDLGAAFERAQRSGQLLFGFASYDMTTTYLGSSTGLRARHDQPTGLVEINAKSSDMTRSTWAGMPTRDFLDVDVAPVHDDLERRLGWAARRLDLEPGRYDTILPAAAVADLMISLYWAAVGRGAHEGRSVFSRAGGGTRVGERLSEAPLTLRSDPTAEGIECDPFLSTTWSSGAASVFDNGSPLPPTEWISAGRLEALVQTRHSAGLTGLPFTPYTDNLILESSQPAGDLDRLIAG